MTTARPRVPALALALSSLVALSACDKDKDKAADGEAKSEDKTDDKKADDKAADAKPADDAKQADAAKAAAPQPVEPPHGGDPAAPLPPPTDVEGAAYFAISGKGIAKLDAAGWSMVLDDGRTGLSKMFAGRDGTVYVIDFDGIKKIEGKQLNLVAKFDYNSFAGASYAVPSHDGTKIYAAGYKGLGVWDGSKWTVTESKALVPELDGAFGLALAGDGTLWTTNNKILAFDKGGAGTWAKFDLSSFGEHFFFMQLSNSPVGDVFVTTGQELVRLTPDKAEKINLKANSRSWASYGSALAYNNAGRVLAASGSCELVSLDPKAPTELWTVEKGAYGCLTLLNAALDGQNRAWVYSREGLSVVAPDKTATEYPTSTVMEIVGSHVIDMVVLGNGPALPPAGPTHTGTVTGKVLLEGSPVANAKLEMCATPSYGGSQPCYDAKVKFAGSTNDKGEFTFADVPIGTYNVAVEIAGKWRMNYLPMIATDMKEGATYDVGAVKFDNL